MKKGLADSVILMLLIIAAHLGVFALDAPALTQQSGQTGGSGLKAEDPRPTGLQSGSTALTLAGSVEGVVAKNLIRDDEPNSIAVYSQLGLNQNEANQAIPDVEVSIGGKTARTDAKGRFRISDLLPMTHEVTLRHILYKQQSPLSVTVRSGEVTTQNYYMRAHYGVLSGKLIDVVTNKPVLHPLINGIPTAAYVYVPENANVLGDIIDEVDFDTKAFSVSVLAGSREVKVSAPGYKPFSTRVTIADSQQLTMDLKLQPLMATITGNVKNSLTAQKITDAVVQMNNLKAVTDQNGAYRASGLPPHEKIQIRVSKEGYEDTVAETVFVPGQQREKDFVLVPKLEDSVIRGRVTDIKSGKPLPGVLLKVLSKAPNKFSDLLETYCTDNAGSFAFRVDKSQGCIVDLYRDGYDAQKLFITWSAELKNWLIAPTDPQGRGSYYVDPNSPVLKLVANATSKALFTCSDFSSGANPGTEIPGATNIPELYGTITDKTTGKPLSGVSVEVGGNRVCTYGNGEYRTKVGPTQSGLADRYTMNVIRNRYRNETYTIERTTVNKKIDIAMVPDPNNKVYQGGCVPTGQGQGASGQMAQELTFTINDVSTGKPVPGVAITGTQVTNRAKPFRICTNERGVAVLKDVSIAVGSESGEMIQNLTMNRNGFEPRQEREYYATYAGRNAIFTLKPNSSYQMLEDCTNQKAVTQYTKDNPIQQKGVNPGETVQVKPVGQSASVQGVKPVSAGVPDLSKATTIQEQQLNAGQGSPGLSPGPTGPSGPANKSTVPAGGGGQTGGPSTVAGQGATGRPADAGMTQTPQSGGAVQAKGQSPAQATLGKPEHLNLQITSFSLRGAGRVKQGSNAELVAEVKNAAKGDAPPGKIKWYISNEPVVKGQGRETAMQPLAGIAAGKSAPVTMNLSLQKDPGAYFISFCIDAPVQGQETRLGCSNAVRVEVIKAGPEQPVMPAGGLPARKK